MKVHRALVILLAALAVLLSTAPVRAQYMSFYPSGGQPAGVHQAAYQWHATPDPAAYAPQAYGPGEMGAGPEWVEAYPPMPYSQGGYEPGQPGCEECMDADGPCGPRWFDVHAEFMYLTRQDVSRRVDFTSEGIDGPIVLSTDDLDFQREPGFRITGRYDVGASSNLEATYFGTFQWSTAAQVTSENDSLFSAISQFGTFPFGGFEDIDQAALQSIEYTSELDSGEVNFRRQWASCDLNCHGSWLIGVRYVQLDERFAFSSLVEQHIDPIDDTLVGPGSFEYRVQTRNQMVGFQLGGDVWACLVPGLMIGGEAKVGLYGNQAEQDTAIQGSTSTLEQPLEETATRDGVAMVAEAGLMGVYQISPGWALRAGYQVLFLDGVALAPENFDPTPPFFDPAPPRVLRVNDNGNVFYHGLTAGLEWTW